MATLAHALGEAASGPEDQRIRCWGQAGAQKAPRAWALGLHVEEQPRREAGPGHGSESHIRHSASWENRRSSDSARRAGDGTASPTLTLGLAEHSR